MTQPKFSLGQCVGTPGAQDLLERHGLTSEQFLRRHESGDWGDCYPEDARQNDDALKNDDNRIHSVYKINDQDTLWIITEWDRSVTTLLLPEEY